MPKGFYERNDAEKERLRNLRRGKRPWNKGEKIDLDKYFNWGMSKKNHSKKSIKKMREVKLGRKNPMWEQHRDLYGSKNPMYGKHHSGDTLKKISTALTGRKYPQKMGMNNPASRPEVKEKISYTRKKQFQNGFIHPRAMLGRHHRVEAKEAISLANRLSNNPNWQGGLSFEPYDSRFNDRLKKRIRKRDDYSCQLCRLTESELGYTLQIHHKDYNKKNNLDTNLISLCLHCHTKTNHNRAKWQHLLQHLIEEKNCA